MVVVEQVEGSGEFVATVNAHPSRVDVDGGHVAPHSPHGIAHAQSLGCALIVGLRKQASVVGTLGESCQGT